MIKKDKNPLSILPEIDRVVVANQVINRPAYMPRSEWLDYWENVIQPQKTKRDTYGLDLTP